MLARSLLNHCETSVEQVKRQAQKSRMVSGLLFDDDLLGLCGCNLIKRWPTDTELFSYLALIFTCCGSRLNRCHLFAS